MPKTILFFAFIHWMGGCQTTGRLSKTIFEKAFQPCGTAVIAINTEGVAGDNAPLAEIIWTGPANNRFPVRRIDQVLYDLALDLDGGKIESVFFLKELLAGVVKVWPMAAMGGLGADFSFSTSSSFLADLVDAAVQLWAERLDLGRLGNGERNLSRIAGQRPARAERAGASESISLGFGCSGAL